MAKYRKYRKRKNQLLLKIILIGFVLATINKMDANLIPTIIALLLVAAFIWLIIKITKSVINIIKKIINSETHQHKEYINVSTAQTQQRKNKTWYDKQIEEMNSTNKAEQIDSNIVNTNDKISGYDSSKSIATETEKAFYKILKQYCDERGYTVNLKTRLEDLVEYAKGMDYATKQKYRGQIKSRHVDYLIVDDDLNPVFAIELDDSSHNKKKAQEIDKFKNDLFDKIGIKLYRVPADEFLWKLELEKLFINVNEERM